MAALLTCEKNNMTAFFHFSAGAGGDPRPGLACQLRQTKNSYSLYSPVDYYRNSARFFLHAESGLWLVKNISGFFASLLGFAAEGTNFVFGGMSEKGLAFIFLGVLCRLCLFPR